LPRATSFALAAVVAFFAAPILSAQATSEISLSNGVMVSIVVAGSASTARPWTPGLEPASGNSFYRIYRDENNLTVFAYEIAVERAGDGDQFRVTAKAATVEFAARFPYADAGKPVPTLSAPMESPLLNSGEGFSIEIPSDTGSSEKLTDIVRTQVHHGGPNAGETVASSARLRFESLKIAVDGAVISPGGAGAIVAGRYVMFYLPGLGGFFFSAEPVPEKGFAKIGKAEAGALSFTVDNQSYECRSDAPILLKAERGEVWVYHDPAYKPSGNWTQAKPEDGDRDEYFAAASDSLGWWLR
jgi:hypothetical protein